MIANNKTEGYLPIGNYGIIGNLHTVALVSSEGSVDYLPFMRVDSPTIFLKLLDKNKGGYFTIHPQDTYATRQFYLTNTNILVTRFYTTGGVVEVTDYMPVTQQEYHCAVVRKVAGITGKVKMYMECSPAFNYAASDHIIQQEVKSYLFLPPGTEQTPVRLATNMPARVEDTAVICEFELDKGEECYFLLEAEHSTSQRTGDVAAYIQKTFTETYEFWTSWVEKCTYEGMWKEEVLRSALVLKLLVSHTYGAPVAAATFSLPEAIGGERNWDYRYVWVRDAAFTMYVFMKLGLFDEADKFIEWIKHQCMADDLQLVYTVSGGKDMNEEELHHLEGYCYSRPVRKGNKASGQTQLDIYGELLDTVYIFVQYARPITVEFWNAIQRQVDHVAGNWQQPDHSIWEVRKGKREFLYSRLMCWVALDRGARIAEHCSFPYPVERWRKARNDIYNDIFKNFWNEERKAFMQYKGSNAVDASMFMMPVVDFLSPYSGYWQDTLKAIEADLVSDVLVYRYLDEENKFDELKGREGAFSICSFWYIICLAKGGEMDKAKKNFERLLPYANHLGLFAEQVSENGFMAGNFPQALTHLSLISAAIELSEKLHLKKKVLPPGRDKMT